MGYPPNRSVLVKGGEAIAHVVGVAKGGGPSRAYGIEVPEVEDTQIFTGKPEGPR